MPILNDKILIRVWDEHTGTIDRLIASIPNVPTHNDVYNISNLLSRGGTLPCQWVNIYGHPPHELTFGKKVKYLMGMAKKSYRGSAFFGRILLSM
jgi:hypothetical protein